MAACGYNQVDVCDKCVNVVRTIKTVQVPCTKNKCNKYSVKVPRQVTEQVPRIVHYTDFETRQKQIPYTDYRSEKRTRMESQNYQVPVTTTKIRMVPVTKKVPKTVYVDVTTQVPETYQKMTMQTKERQVPVPYYVNVPEPKYRIVREQVPVQKSKVQMDTVVKTVYDTQVRTRIVPQTKIVTKQIPVYSVVPRAAPAVPSGDMLTSFNRVDENLDDTLGHSRAADAKKDSHLSFEEYAGAQVGGNVGVGLDAGQVLHSNGHIVHANGVSDVVTNVATANGQTLTSGTLGCDNTVISQAGMSDIRATSTTIGANVMKGSANNLNEYGRSSSAQAVSSVYANDDNTVVGQASMFGNGATSTIAGANVMNGSANFRRTFSPQAVSSGYANDYGTLNGARNTPMQWRLCYNNDTANLNGALGGSNDQLEWCRCLK